MATSANKDRYGKIINYGRYAVDMLMLAYGPEPTYLPGNSHRIVF